MLPARLIFQCVFASIKILTITGLIISKSPYALNVVC
jgi:hypothetical protein